MYNRIILGIKSWIVVSAFSPANWVDKGEKNHLFLLEFHLSTEKQRAESGGLRGCFQF